MGHELGHYVINHIYKGLATMSLLILPVSVLSSGRWTRLLRALAPRWPAGGGRCGDLPPVRRGVLGLCVRRDADHRRQHSHAGSRGDRFGMNLAREPHGEAEVDLKLTEYRKPDPTPLEEFVFFDHPSTRFRIHDAMRWRQAMGTP